MSLPVKVVLGLLVVIGVALLARPAPVDLPPELEAEAEAEREASPEPDQPQLDVEAIPPLRRSLLVHALGAGTLVSRASPVRLPTALRDSAVNVDGSVVAAVVGPQEAIGPDIVAYRTGDLGALLHLRRQTDYAGHLMVAPEGDALVWLVRRDGASALRRQPLGTEAGSTVVETPSAEATVPLPAGARVLDARTLVGRRAALLVQVGRQEEAVEVRVLVVDLQAGAIAVDVALPPEAAGSTGIAWDVAEGGRLLAVHPDGAAVSEVILSDGEQRRVPVPGLVVEAAAAPRRAVLVTGGDALLIFGPGSDREGLGLLRLPVGGGNPVLGTTPSTGLVTAVSPDGGSVLLRGARLGDTDGGSVLQLVATTTLAVVAERTDDRQLIDADFAATGAVGVSWRAGAEWSYALHDGGTLDLLVERRFGILHRSIPAVGILIEGIGG